MPDHSCRFNVLSQLSEEVLTRILQESQSAGDFPSRWVNRIALNSAPLEMELGFGYDFSLGRPILETEADNAGNLTLSFTVSGRLFLDADIAARTPVEASSHLIPVPFHGLVKANVPLSIARLGSYGYLELASRELRAVNVDVEIAYDTTVGGNGPVFDHMIQRIALTHLYNLTSIPISHAFELEITTGWAITNYTTRIIDGAAELDNVTIALNTWPNRNRGRAADLHDWVNPGFDFAICYDERLLVQAVELGMTDDRIPKAYDDNGCPRPTGPVRVQDITINLGEGDIGVFIQATRQGANFDARGRVKLNVAPVPILHLEIDLESGSLAFFRGVVRVLLRALFAVTGLETFADPSVPDRERACRDRVLPPSLCGTDLSLILHAPVPLTRVQLEYQVARIDVTSNELSMLGYFVITHT